MSIVRTLTRVPERLRDLVGNTGGSTLTLFALTIPLVFGVAAAALDYTSMAQQRTRMQAAADAAALDAARELHLARSANTNIAELARNYARAMLARSPSLAAAQVDAKVIDNDTAVDVVVSLDVAPMFARFVSNGNVRIQAEAIARVSGGYPICLIGLDPSAPGTVHLEANARLTAENCAVYSDSKSTHGLQSVDSAVLKAGLICTAGGRVGTHGNYTPAPTTDCPVLPDPLAARPAPPIGPCIALGKIVAGMTVTLNPGTYCGGLVVSLDAQVKLNPGIYVIKDGPLFVHNGATFEGTNVGFYLTGDLATVTFEAKTTVNLTAPKDGPMSGILLFEDRASKPLLKHKILSNNARILLGTIYVPNGRLIIDAAKPIADKSAYTIIVTRRLELYSGPNLVLNTDYAGSDIPTPKGVGIVGDSVSLVK